MRTVQRHEGPEKLVRRCVETLAFGIGERCTHRMQALEAEAKFFEMQLAQFNYIPRRSTGIFNGRPVHVVEAELPGAKPQFGVVACIANTDAAFVFPPESEGVLGAAALLALAEAASRRRYAQTLRFAFVIDLEVAMRPEQRVGCELYARTCRARVDDLRLVMAIEGIGDARSHGHFSFESGLSSWRSARKVARAFRQTTGLPARWWSGPSALVGSGRGGPAHGPFAANGFDAVTVRGGRGLGSLLKEQTFAINYPLLVAGVHGLLTTLDVIADPGR